VPARFYNRFLDAFGASGSELEHGVTALFQSDHACMQIPRLTSLARASNIRRASSRMLYAA